MTALTSGRPESTTWLRSGPPAQDGRHPGVEYDPSAPLFGQLGDDARQATAARGEAGLARLEEELVAQIQRFLDQRSLGAG